jgi:phosphoribosylformylglycinamidine synthase subunit PurS
VARVVVDVMPKPEILDPQGQAVHRALGRLGFAGAVAVRQGKRFELELDDAAYGSTEDLLAAAATMADTLLANIVIEDYSVRLES